MRVIQGLALLIMMLVTVTSCTSTESPTYPTIAGINELLASNQELFTDAAEILRSHKNFFDFVYEQTDQWRITSFDQEWLPSYFSETEIEAIRSVMELAEPRDVKYLHFTVPMSPYNWETTAPAIQFSYQVQNEDGSVDVYQLCYIRADNSGTEEEKIEAVEAELAYLQRNSSVLKLDIDGWYGIT
jgi:hypothetical protein